MTDYEKQYQKSGEVCGPPLPEIVAFFEDYMKPRAMVLDLGCGQGRDALLAARRGHQVLGVDISRSGIAQMIAEAEKEALDVRGVVADVVEYQPPEDYDVVVLDRVLHMLKGDNDRITVLEKAGTATKARGFILIADTPKHQQLIRSFFEDRSMGWLKIKDKKGIIFIQRSDE